MSKFEEDMMRKLDAVGIVLNELLKTDDEVLAVASALVHGFVEKSGNDLDKTLAFMKGAIEAVMAQEREEDDDD